MSDLPTAAKEMAEALRPLARLQIPNRPQGNVGAYSIYHKDIKAAQEALSRYEALSREGGEK